MEAVKRRILLLKNEEVKKLRETEQFLTVLTGIKDVEKARQAHELMKLKASRKNQIQEDDHDNFKVFNYLLALEKDPRIAAIKAKNPLNQDFIPDYLKPGHNGMVQKLEEYFKNMILENYVKN